MFIISEAKLLKNSKMEIMIRFGMVYLYPLKNWLIQSNLADETR